jgi:hypothetical protein
VLGKPGQDRQRSVLILAEAEQAGELLADQLGGRPADARGGRPRQAGKAQCLVGLPGPVGSRAQEVRVALGRRGQRGGQRRSLAPAGDRERHFVAGRIGADPQVDVAVAVGGDRGAGDGDAEPARETGQSGDLRDRQDAALAAASARVQLGERRVGRHQPPVGVDPAGNRPLAFDRGVHAASAAAERTRVEIRATLAR